MKIKINIAPTVTNNKLIRIELMGFYFSIQQNDGNSVTDQSGQGNNFSVGSGTLRNKLRTGKHIDAIKAIRPNAQVFLLHGMQTWLNYMRRNRSKYNVTGQ